MKEFFTLVVSKRMKKEFDKVVDETATMVSPTFADKCYYEEYEEESLSEDIEYNKEIINDLKLYHNNRNKKMINNYIKKTRIIHRKLLNN